MRNDYADFRRINFSVSNQNSAPADGSGSHAIGTTNFEIDFRLAASTLPSRWNKSSSADRILNAIKLFAAKRVKNIIALCLSHHWALGVASAPEQMFPFEKREKKQPIALRLVVCCRYFSFSIPAMNHIVHRCPVLSRPLLFMAVLHQLKIYKNIIMAAMMMMMMMTEK